MPTLRSLRVDRNHQVFTFTFRQHWRFGDFFLLVDGSSYTWMTISFHSIIYISIHGCPLFSIVFSGYFHYMSIFSVFQNSKNIPPKAARKQRPWLQRPLVRVAEVELGFSFQLRWAIRKPNPPRKSWIFDGFFLKSWWGETWWIDFDGGNLMEGIKPTDFRWIAHRVVLEVWN